jgi:CDP-4-dehydro-6-deoxyglucose reductase, E3
MAQIQFEGRAYTLHENESVLDGLLRHEVRLSHSCKAGVCGSCVMRTASGSVPARAQAGLKDSWRAQGYFLACVCIPEENLEVVQPGDDLRFGGTIVGLQSLSADVLRARLTTDTPMEFRAGQYVTIVRSDGLARSYSIASLVREKEIELHIRRVAQGQMSGWFHDQATVGSRVTVQGPSGECFYVGGREEQPLLLAGVGTGLAPLYGIVRDALESGHRGRIHLFHGALHAGGLYLVNELRGLAREYPQLQYSPAVLKGEPSDEIAVGPLDRIIAERIPDLKGWRGFVCGDPVLVNALKKKLFLSGMASRDIYADAFIPAAPASAASA